MTFLQVLGAAFAAFCVWLAVRIVNRRERWAIDLAIYLAIAVALGMAFQLVIPKVQT